MKQGSQTDSVPVERWQASASLPTVNQRADLQRLASPEKEAHCAIRFMPSRHAIILWHNWAGVTMKNFHLPLPERTYAQLRAEAERTQVPATILAREAIDLWLRDQLRLARHSAISAYAAEMAGSSFDLDTDLESTGIEHLLKTGKKSK